METLAEPLTRAAVATGTPASAKTMFPDAAAGAMVAVREIESPWVTVAAGVTRARVVGAGEREGSAVQS